MNDASKPRLINYLESLVHDARHRAALAALRGSLRDGHALDAARYVFPQLAADSTRRDEDDALLLAGLFALHPEAGTLTLASALRHVQTKSGSDSVEGRFRALLSASRDELPVHLRNAVCLIAAHKLPLNWADLYDAIRYWTGDHARRRWAGDYWAARAADDETSADLSS